MAKRKTFVKKRRTRELTPRPEPVVRERRPPVTYGKPIIMLEDEQKNTFVYQGGAWIPHELTIAQCRETCKVKELPQKVNRHTRYEVCFPV